MESVPFWDGLQVKVEVYRERRGCTPGYSSEEFANKGLILARVKKSAEVIDNKGRKIGALLYSCTKSERVRRLGRLAELKGDFHEAL